MTTSDRPHSEDSCRNDMSEDARLDETDRYEIGCAVSAAAGTGHEELIRELATRAFLSEIPFFAYERTLARVRAGLPLASHTEIRRQTEMLRDAARREHSPRFRWADQHPDALQDIVDPSIRIVDDDVGERWALPAGWVNVVNHLHADLIELLGEYEIVRVGNKMAALRYAIDRYRRHDDGPEVWDAVTSCIDEAVAESLGTCDLCGGHAVGRLSFGVTRCAEHPSGRERFTGARARPPGWHEIRVNDFGAPPRT